MTSPLYSVGQHVAVCTGGLELVLPATRILAVEWDPAGAYYSSIADRLLFLPAGWSYRIPETTDWIREKWLRPIQPGEYLSDSAPQKLETTL